MDTTKLILLILSNCLLIAMIVISIIRGGKTLEKRENKDILDAIKQEGERTRETTELSGRLSSQSLFEGVRSTNEQVLNQVKEMSRTNESRIVEMKEELYKSLSDIRGNLNKSLTEVREDNAKQLETMRQTVDEKLSTTLDERLSKSFSIISERLEAVQKGLGEMHSLTGDVVDLKKVLTNVKTRGGWGEVSLDSILSDILLPEQYERNSNVSGKRSQERVDFAIILPGSGDKKIKLPIDVKFPIEDYVRMNDAFEEGDMESYHNHQKTFINVVKAQARSISSKYINVPHTTDFAIMFLPIEGLYSEILKEPGLVEELQNNFKIVPAGPTNIVAMLSIVRMGFRSITIQKHSQEVFKILEQFRKDFSTFTGLVEKAQGQIDSASKSLSNATKRTEIINKKLSNIGKIDMPDDDDILPPLIG